MKKGFLSTSGLIIFSIIALLSLVGISCSKDDNGNTGFSKFMVIYASPGAPAADLLLNNQKLNTDPLNYPSNTSYLDIPSGNHTIQLNEAGTSTKLTDALVQVPGGINFTLLYFDNYTAGIQTLTVNDIFTIAPSGKSYVRFFHLSPGGPKVDGGFIKDGNFNKVFFSRNFESTFSVDSTGLFVAVDTGTYDFDLRIPSANVSVLTRPGVKLEDGKVYTYYLRGNFASATTPPGVEIIANR